MSDWDKSGSTKIGFVSSNWVFSVDPWVTQKIVDAELGLAQSVADARFYFAHNEGLAKVMETRLPSKSLHQKPKVQTPAWMLSRCPKLAILDLLTLGSVLLI